MNRRHKLGAFVVAVSLLSACGGAADDAAQEQGGDTAAMAAPVSADANGTWNMSATPVGGSDTTSTIYQMQVTNDSWILMLPNRDPIAARAVTEGDSIIVEAGPYESVRRAGTMVSTHSVMRVNGDQITGTTEARYQTSGADSVLRLTIQGTRAR